MYSIEQIKGFYNRYKHEQLALHFRMATAGVKNQSNCHPFQILSLEEDGMDLWMMHNGTFFDYREDASGRSDTAMFAAHLTYRMRNEGFSLAKPECIQELEDNASWNKLLFMNGWGDVVIINEGGGAREEECWYSYTMKNRYNYGNYYKPATTTTLGKWDDRDTADDTNLVDWWEKQFNNNRISSFLL